MTTLRRFNTDSLHADTFFIGFDSIVSKLNQQSNNTSGNYPPYNIIKTDENSYVVELAVAGLSTEDIDIMLQEGVLTVEGTPCVSEGLEYVHKGIAARSFKRTFTLADTVEVTGADMVNGMLLIRLENVIPDAKKARKIEISSPEDNKEFLAEYET
jgi:molecular chaperone IbpA